MRWRNLHKSWYEIMRMEEKKWKLTESRVRWQRWFYFEVKGRKKQRHKIHIRWKNETLKVCRGKKYKKIRRYYKSWVKMIFLKVNDEKNVRSWRDQEHGRLCVESLTGKLRSLKEITKTSKAQFRTSTNRVTGFFMAETRYRKQKKHDTR